jgi:hypothetical protein
MILYELRCGAGHGFEAWFRNSDAYDAQHAAQQISCPVCGGHDVAKAPMAPRIGRSGRRSREAAQEIAMAEAKAPEPPQPPAPVLSAQDHEKMRMVMSKIAELNQHIAATCDYVGKSFPEEARKIHYGEAPVREIYGEASPSEAAELREEGIAVASLPWLKRTDS